MADNDGKAPTMQIDTSNKGGWSGSVDLGGEDRTKVGEVALDTEEGVVFGADGKVTPVTAKEAAEGGGEQEPDSNAPEAGEEAGAEGADDKGDGEGKAEPDTSEPLPEFNAEDETVVAAYDERFYPEVDGKRVLSFENLGAEVYANSQKEGGTPVLNEGTYAWLESMGIPRERADLHIAGEIAVKERREAGFYEAVGGKDLWEAEVAWGKANYTPEQKARFKAAMDKGGEDAQEQIDLLKARAAKGGFKFTGKTTAAPKADAPAKKPGGLRRDASPKKTTSAADTPTKGGGNAAPYANADEHRKALREAGSDPTAQALVSKRLAASTFWK